MGHLMAKFMAICEAVMTRFSGSKRKKGKSKTNYKRAARKGEFDWRLEDPAALRYRNRLPIEAFVKHLSALNLNDGITRANLIGIYHEWIDANEARPIEGWQRWDRALRACGVTKRRSSLPGRPRLYYAPIALPAPALAKAAIHKEQGREAA